MRHITAHNGKLQVLGQCEVAATGSRMFDLGMERIDRLCGGFVRGAIHEILFAPGDPAPLTFATLLARAAGGGEKISDLRSQISDCRRIAWIDPDHELYPPALAAMGISLRRLYLIRPRSPAEVVWATAECLRCPGVGAVVVRLGRLSQIQTRRLQLSAERGGGIGILLRDGSAACYAAATRWLVRPLPGTRTIQRWNVELLHSQAGHVGQRAVLEVCRATHHVRASAPLADRAVEATRMRLSA